MTANIMRDNFLLIVAAYGVHKRMPETAISKKIYGNQAFMERYRKGEVSPTIRNYFAMIDKMAEDWPEDAPWPETMPIPKLGKKLSGDQSGTLESERIA